MFKTYLVFIPFFAIFPFIFKAKVLRESFYWLGLIVGFLPL